MTDAHQLGQMFEKRWGDVSAVAICLNTPHLVEMRGLLEKKRQEVIIVVL